MILLSGCFDGLSGGHALYVEKARGQGVPGERLLVAVAPDGYIRAEKHREPHFPQADRGMAVLQLKGVDGVILYGDTSLADLVRGLRPRLFIKGADWIHRPLPTDLDHALAEAGTRFVMVDAERTHGSHAWPAKEDVWTAHP